MARAWVRWSSASCATIHRRGRWNTWRSLNIGENAITLYDATHGNPWHLDGLAYDFPADTTIAAGGVLLVVGGDPDSFRSAHGVDAAIPVLGPVPGKLDNGGETIALQYPDTPEEVDGEIVVPMITIDAVDYDDDSPWPSEPGTTSSALERIALGAYGDDPANWRSAEPSPGSVDLARRRITIKADPPEGVEAAIDGGAGQPVPHTFDAGAPSIDHLIEFFSIGGGG